ncbi:MAG: HAMP domain-containing histidine kinase [Candidatus Heimdallarchaeota archaeon]|nr:HAMP domain-containing histidine kinase [Candidatus Heimdallarchaeota archaeon]
MIQMENNLVSDTLEEFLLLLKNNELVDSREKKNIILKIASSIRNSLDPAIILVSKYSSENLSLIPFCLTDEHSKFDDVEIEIDFFDDSKDPFAESFSGSELTWATIDQIPDNYDYKRVFQELEVVDIIISPLVINDHNIGAVVVLLFENTVRYNKEKYIEIVKESTVLISDILASWANEYLATLKQHQTDLIVEMSNLTLETTEIQLILNRILPKIKSETGIECMGVFLKDIEEVSLIQHIGLNEDIIQYYKSPTLDISSLRYYNTSNKIDEVSFANLDEQYGLILPIGSINLMFGFLLVISNSQEKLSESNIHFLRIMANQLFLTLQRKRLLDDIQQITQTSEFSAFPVMLAGNRFEMIYLNKQAEQTFNLTHDESVGLKLDHLLNLDADKAKLMLQKIREVIANIAKDTMKLEIEIFQMGNYDTRTFFVQMSPTINNLTGEYCVVLSLVDISEATKLQSIAEEYSNRSRMYLNVLTHDIYNILFGISGYYELLKDNIPQEEDGVLERVNTLVKRGTSIVQDIRLLSNVLDVSSADELHFVPLKMTMLRVIEKAKEEFTQTLFNVTIDIPNMIKIHGGTYLYDMFYYVLVSLAQKTSDSKVIIEITGIEIVDEEGNEFFEIDIIDKKGIPPELREEIQRAIEQSPFDETLRKHLGFMIVKEIAKKYAYILKIEDKDSSDWTKGFVIKIIMQKSMEIEKE